MGCEVLLCLLAGRKVGAAEAAVEGPAAEEAAAALEEGFNCGEEETLLVEERVRFREERGGGSCGRDGADAGVGKDAGVGAGAGGRRPDWPLLGRSDAGGTE